MKFSTQKASFGHVECSSDETTGKFLTRVGKRSQSKSKSFGKKTKISLKRKITDLKNFQKEVESLFDDLSKKIIEISNKP